MSCEIVAFPASRRRVRILEAVKMLNETHGAAANEAWKVAMRSMADELLAMGVSNADMRQQVLEFQAAVQLEMQAQFERELMAAEQNS